MLYISWLFLLLFFTLYIVLWVRGQYNGTLALTCVRIHTTEKKKTTSNIHAIKHKSKRQTFTGRSKRNIDSIVLCCAELAMYLMVCLYWYVFVCVCVFVSICVRTLTLIDYTRQPMAEYSYENKNFCPKAGVCPRTHLVWYARRTAPQIAVYSVEL